MKEKKKHNLDIDSGILEEDDFNVKKESQEGILKYDSQFDSTSTPSKEKSVNDNEEEFFSKNKTEANEGENCNLNANNNESLLKNKDNSSNNKEGYAEKFNNNSNGKYDKYESRKTDDKRRHQREDEEEFKINYDKITSLNEIKKKEAHELIDLAKEYEVNLNRMSKNEIIYSILVKIAEKGESVTVGGVLDISEEGFGFIKYLENNYKNSLYDIYVPNKIIRNFFLRTGDYITCFIKPPRKNERYFSLAVIKEINNQPSNSLKNKINFENLVPIFPKEKFNFENKVGNFSISPRIIDLICPIGKGQRALIVAPPRTGKTELIKSIAEAISINHPEVKIISLNIDERPEEATDMLRSIKGEVVCSTFDEPAQRHVNAAEITIERAKRLVEQGYDVVILLDSITRLARAYNAVAPSSGKVLSGGVDSNALHKPKRFFGAARNIERGGSLTIIATALVDTGSKMDEVIFEEFKGTGNCEIVLDRKLSDKRFFPAIDILKSGTRKEDEMMPKERLQRMWLLRRFLTQNSSNTNLNQASNESLEFLLKRVNDTESNSELLEKMNKLN